MTAVHTPVLLAEAVALFLTDPDGLYVDGTFGRGGHSAAILAQLSTSGRLLGFDKDPAAVAVGAELAARDPRFAIRHQSFAELAAHLPPAPPLKGVLLDLGVSSPQLDDPERGFSFTRDGPLDMRMDTSRGPSAQEWLAEVDEAELVRVLFEYGEERFARRMARAVIEARAKAPLTTTGQLAEVIAAANPKWEVGKHPATRAFQAIRIAINSELADLAAALTAAAAALAPGGRLVVISFHSLEDRLVKRFMRDLERGPRLPKEIPLPAEASSYKVLGRAIKPSPAEVNNNPRARSAVLRAVERLID